MSSKTIFFKREDYNAHNELGVCMKEIIAFLGCERKTDNLLAMVEINKLKVIK